MPCQHVSHASAHAAQSENAVITHIVRSTTPSLHLQHALPPATSWSYLTEMSDLQMRAIVGGSTGGKNVVAGTMLAFFSPVDGLLTTCWAHLSTKPLVMTFCLKGDEASS